jgi:S1-C subfamily serine protease
MRTHGLLSLIGFGYLLSLVLLIPLRSEAVELNEIFQRVNDAVVVLHTSERAPTPQTESGFTSLSGLGSGVLISRDGKVMTAAHVVQAADEVEVEFLDGTKVPGRVVSSAPDADVALVQLERVPSGATVVEMGDSDQARVGDQVFIVGAPYGVSHTLTVGYVSGRHKQNSRYAGLFDAEMLQTDASINQGNSGGPMFNMDGQVIGIVSHIMSQSGGSEGLGFVITSNMAQDLLLRKKHFWSGVTGFMLMGELAELFNVPPPGVGMLVQKVAKGSPAEKLGLKGGSFAVEMGQHSLILGGDIILEVNGISMAENDRVKSAILGLKAGKALRVTVLRGGKTMKLLHQLTTEDIPE